MHHEQPVPSETLRCALWPLDDDGNEVAYTTFKQAMSRARSTLGTDSSGERHLPDAHDGSYRLGPRVRSDWERFRQLTPGEAVLSVITYGELVYGAEKSQFREQALRQLAELAGLLPVMELPMRAGETSGDGRFTLRAKVESVGRHSSSRCSVPAG